MEQSKILEVFDVDVENLTLEEDVKKDQIYFNPKVKAGDEPYSALIRILPIPIKKDGVVTGFEKNTAYYMQKRYWLEDTNGESGYYTTPLTIGESCPIQKAYYKLKESDDVRDQKKAESLRISTHYWSLIYVISDKQNPELVGKTLIWKYTKPVKEMIDKELNPVVSEFQKKPKVAVWDVETGKNLALIIKASKVRINGKERDVPSYADCEFLTSTPLEIDGMQISKQDPESLKRLTDLYNESPNEMGNFKYHPWTDSEKETIMNILNTSYSISSSVASQTVSDTDVSLPKEGDQDVQEVEDLINSLNFDENE